MKTKKRFLSILLSLALVLGLMPGMSMTAFAEGHTHNFEYYANGDTITATCKVEGCTPDSSKVTLKIGDPTTPYYDDKDSSHEFTLEGLDAFIREQKPGQERRHLHGASQEAGHAEFR